MELLFIIAGILIGAVIGFLLFKLMSNSPGGQEKFNQLDREYIAFKATTIEQQQTAAYRIDEKQRVIDGLKTSSDEMAAENGDLKNQLATITANLQASSQSNQSKDADIESLKKELKEMRVEFDSCNKQLATAKAVNASLDEKLENQKAEMSELGKKFNTEFENIANKIMEVKTAKFTELNKTNMKDLLEPLGKNIDEFKKTVNETYDKEAKERFSLGERVKELAQLNKVISEEARNLTNALKSEAKTQGGWGEMILESILEKSGLRKNEEYFMECQLEDLEGNALRSDSANKKMRPDAVIKYPDSRSVIIDSKVSLNAFTRYIDAEDEATRKMELASHVTAVKRHIDALSARGYDDYDKSLDFVMMFVPSEPAYIAALQGDSELWNYAYQRRILLVNPTNLIISLKLIVDLWKREYQNRNAQDIAERGAKLYDKFVGFVKDLEDIGKHIDKAKASYDDSYKKLSTGSDNLVAQTEKLKKLGLKTKKSLAEETARIAIGNEISEVV